MHCFTVFLCRARALERHLASSSVGVVEKRVEGGIGQNEGGDPKNVQEEHVSEEKHLYKIYSN